jgi:hypothetical protein
VPSQKILKFRARFERVFTLSRVAGGQDIGVEPAH